MDSTNSLRLENEHVVHNTFSVKLEITSRMAFLGELAFPVRFQDDGHPLYQWPPRKLK